MIELGVAGLEETDEGRGRELPGGRLHLSEPAAPPEDLEEPAALVLGAAQREHLPEHDRPAGERKGEEEAEHEERHRPGAEKGREQAGTCRRGRDLEQEMECGHGGRRQRSTAPAGLSMAAGSRRG